MDFNPKNKNEYYEDFLKMNTRINDKTWYLYNETIVPGLKKANHEFMENIQRENQRYYKFSFEDSIFIKEQTILTVLLGKYDDVVGYKDQLDFFQKLPNSTISIFSDGGHNLFIDNFNFSHTYIDNFIQRLEHEE